MTLQESLEMWNFDIVAFMRAYYRAAQYVILGLITYGLTWIVSMVITSEIVVGIYMLVLWSTIGSNLVISGLYVLYGWWYQRKFTESSELPPLLDLLTTDNLLMRIFQ